MLSCDPFKYKNKHIHANCINMYEKVHLTENGLKLKSYCPENNSCSSNTHVEILIPYLKKRKLLLVIKIKSFYDGVLFILQRFATAELLVSSVEVTMVTQCLRSTDSLINGVCGEFQQNASSVSSL